MPTSLVRPLAHTELSNLDTGKRVNYRDTEALIGNVSFLFGKNVEHVVESNPNRVQLIENFKVNPDFYTTTVEWFYKRSPGVKFATIMFELHKTTATYTAALFYYVITATLPPGVVYATPTDASTFTLPSYTAGRLDEPNLITYRATVDVSALNTTAVQLFKLTIAGAGPTTSATYLEGGFSKVSMQEVPVDILQVGGTEMTGSVDDLWTNPYRRVVGGAITSTYGFERLDDQTKLVRSEVKNHWQIINHQGSAGTDYPSKVWANTPNISSTTTLLTPLYFQIADEANYQSASATTGPEFWIRTRNYDGVLIDGTGLADGTKVNRYSLYVRFRTSQSVYPCTFRMYYLTEASGLTGYVDITLPASTALWKTGTANIDIPCDIWQFQKEQLVKIWFDVSVSNIAQNLYVSAIALIENETLRPI